MTGTGQIGPADLVQYASAAGFSGQALQTAVAISLAEDTTSNPHAISPTGDYGLWQINLAAHPDVTQACAFDPYCAAQAAYRISQGGTDWTPWVTFNTGAFAHFLSIAGDAIQTVIGSILSILHAFYASNLITQVFGVPDVGVPGQPPHTGVDFGHSMGEQIPSLQGGTVVQAGPNDGYGNAVTVKLQNGDTVLYGHMSQVNVSVGQTVGQGQTLGLVGSTGNSTGPHVHVELRKPDGTPVDPLPWIAQTLSGSNGPGGIIGAVGSLVSGATGKIGGAVGSVTGGLSALGDLAGSISSDVIAIFKALGTVARYLSVRKHWWKIVFTLFAGSLVIVGAVIVLRGDEMINTAAELAQTEAV